MVNGVTKSSGQGGTGVLAPIRECPPGGWRGKKESGKDREGAGGGAKRAPPIQPHKRRRKKDIDSGETQTVKR